MRRSKISFILERGELKLLEGVCFLEPGLADRVQGARKVRGGYKVTFYEENFEESLDALSFQIEEIKSEVDKQSLSNLQEKIRRYSLLSPRFQKTGYGCDIPQRSKSSGLGNL